MPDPQPVGQSERRGPLPDSEEEYRRRDEEDRRLGVDRPTPEPVTERWLVRLGVPSKSDTIHRNDCPVIARAKGRPLRWNWADKNPEIDWRVSAPWLRACKVCHPPSPAGKESNA